MVLSEFIIIDMSWLNYLLTLPTSNEKSSAGKALLTLWLFIALLQFH